MTDDERRAALESAVRRGSRPGGLARACLLVARGAHPRLDPTVPLAEIARLAARVRAEVRRRPKRLQAAVVADVLGRAEGFGGAVVDYDDPEMSYLHSVLARRRGLPILVSIVWIEVARAAGLVARPVPFPGHFAAMVGEEIVDPYAGGRRMAKDEVLRLFEASGASRTSMHQSATARRVLLRVLANLANAYERRGEGAQLDVVLTDALSLAPRDAAILLRRGETRARFDDRAGALRDLNRALPLLRSGPLYDRAHAAAASIVRARASSDGISVN